MKYKNLEISGAGVFGVVYVGVLQAYEDCYGKGSVQKNVERVVGVSAGSLLSIFISLGMSVEEMEETLMNLDFKDFAESYQKFDLSLQALETLIANTRGHYGLNSGEGARTWVDNLVASKLGKQNATFADLEEFNKKNGRSLELSILGTNITGAQSVVFSAKLTPNMIIAEAIRISISIPLFFDFVVYDHSIFVDGGVIHNIPLAFFAAQEGVDINESLCLSIAEAQQSAKSAIGIKAMRDAETSGKTKDFFGQQISASGPGFSWKEYLLGISEAALLAQPLYAGHFAKVFKLNYLPLIPPSGVTSIDFNVSAEDKKRMMQTGYQQGLEFFQRNR